MHLSLVLKAFGPLISLMANRNAANRHLFATRFVGIDSRESFAIKTPIFIARQADSHESLEFPGDSRELCESMRANHATKVAATVAAAMALRIHRCCREESPLVLRTEESLKIGRGRLIHDVTSDCVGLAK